MRDRWFLVSVESIESIRTFVLECGELHTSGEMVIKAWDTYPDLQAVETAFYVHMRETH